ncbi:MAG: DUF1697 domain-containing protein [Wenzhouxiangellaceae bacterium]|nr:DUF1697 domain-containing protein [Wenzhouxiangellaceae bacterium]
MGFRNSSGRPCPLHCASPPLHHDKAMNSRVLLLRGINVGGRNRLPMADLVELVADCGGTQVRTWIQSGNVVYRGSLDATALGQRIEQRHGFRPETVVIDAADFRDALEAVPFGDEDARNVHLYFFDGARPDATERLESLASAREDWQLREGVLYLHAPDGVARSRLVAGIDRALGVPATGRKLSTLRRVQELVED